VTEVGERVDTTSWEPKGIAGLFIDAVPGAVWRELPARVSGLVCCLESKIADRDYQGTSGRHGRCASGLQFDFAGADAVFYEEDFLSAAVEDFDAAVFVPFRLRVAELVILQEFDGQVAKGLRGAADYVDEGGGEESDLVGLQLYGDRIFACDGIDDLRGAEHDVDVVVCVTVQESLGVRRDVDVEDADLVVGEHEMMVRLGGDVDFRSRLRGEECGQEQDEQETGHRGDCISAVSTQHSANARLIFLSADC
jgi:hypothetical protein